MACVNFIYPNKQGDTVQIEVGKSTFRSVAQKLQYHQPDEFTIVIEKQNNTIISKYQDKLISGRTYSIVSVKTLYQNVQELEANLKKEQRDRQGDRQINNEEKLELEKSITTQKVQIAELEKSNFNLSQSYDDKGKVLLKEKNEMKVKLENIEKKLAESQKDIQFASSQQQLQKQDYEQKLKEREQQIQNNNSELQILQQNLYVYYQKVQVQKEENFKLTNDLTSHQQYYSNVIERWQQEYNKLNYSYLSVVAEKEVLQTSLQKLQGEKNSLKDFSDAKKKEVGELEDQVQQLKFDQNKKIREIENSFNSIRKLKLELEESQQQLKDNNTQIGKLNSDVEKKIAQIKELKQQKVHLEEEQTPIQNLQSSINTQQLQQLTNFSFEAKRRIEAQLEEIGGLKVQLSEISQDKKQLEENITIIKKEKISLEEKQSELELKIFHYEQDMLRIRVQIQKESENSKQTYTQQLNDLLSKKSDVENVLQKRNQMQEIEITRLRDENKKIQEQKENVEQEINTQREKYQKIILDFDQEMMNKDKEILQTKLDFRIPTSFEGYAYRITRLVELIPREYASEIEFAIETMMRTKIKFDDFFKQNAGECKQQTFDLCQVTYPKDELHNILYKVGDQNFSKFALKTPIGEITGNRCYKAVNCSDSSLDRAYLFKCSSCPKMKVLEGKVFAVKEYIKGEIQDLETEQTALDNCLGTLLAEAMLDSFILELSKKNVENTPKNFKFQKQFIIKCEKHFNQVFDEEIKKQQLMNQTVGFKFFVTFIGMIGEENSDLFYDDIRQFQLDKERNKKKDKKDGFSLLQEFMAKFPEPLKSKTKKIFDQHEQLTINQGLVALIDFLGGIAEDMPRKIFYAMQQIDIGDGFTKYNGGHMKFDVDPRGKFFSAFSYYSIVKSHRQVCVSHLQGVGNQLYYPLVSTYDGFLDKLDQGYNEIKTIESKFLSESNANKGVEFLLPLGIQWK